jgi:dipeptidase E
MRLYLSSFRLGDHPDELLRLLDGDSRAAVIANADDFKTGADRVASAERELADLAGLGLEPVEVDLREYFGQPARLREVLARFDAVWIRGGNPFILRRALRYSGADAIIAELLADDTLVYAGYSAGLAMLCPSLHGIELIDPPNLVPDGYEAEVIWDCLGVLPYMVVPHYRSDHPESADAERSVQHMIDHHVPFLALRDGQVIVRDGERETVLA